MIQVREDVLTNSIDKARSRTECLWSSPPSDLSAVDGEVHVWCIHLNMPSIQIKQMEGILSDDELAKANHFQFEKHRRRFIARHGMLRKILGKYLYLEPSKIQFNYSPLGKPSLAFHGTQNTLCFNLSHSNELALCAVTLNKKIGIDLELVRSLPDMAPIAKRFFSPREYKIIYSYYLDQRKYTFYDLWTLKEAYLKATGRGIGDLEQVELSLSSDTLSLLIIDKENSRAAECWTIVQLNPAQGYTAGLAVEAKDVSISQYYYS